MFQAGLDYDLAQKIVDNIMMIVPYNINIMDKSGTIIASGNSMRINKAHFGAIKALELNEAYFIYEDTELEKKGINVPFRYKGEIVGVIGVSGEPKEVEPIANIVRVTAELMIDKQIYDNRAYARDTKTRDFFNELTINPEFLEGQVAKSLASELGIDLSLERTAVILKVKESSSEVTDFIRKMLHKGEYVIRESMLNAVVFFLSGENLIERIKVLLTSNDLIQAAYVGYDSTNMYQSFESANSALQVADKLNINESIMKISDYVLEDVALQIQSNDHIKAIGEALENCNKGDALKETLVAYVRTGFDVSRTCEELFIHKNTFYYRMQRLKAVTGFETGNLKDLITLYMFLVNSSL
ncbi:MAG: helix-turn-helix domain-containing protein [Bacilli bacterium]|nr:helix-turn-helix domain-containing protein [Bacilli bacterium]MBN2696388.1 helix-turn-helix domain-containing protein [Bacilli bacterium]